MIKYIDITNFNEVEKPGSIAPGRAVYHGQIQVLLGTGRGVRKSPAAGSPQQSRVSEGRNRNACILF